MLIYYAYYEYLIKANKIQNRKKNDLISLLLLLLLVLNSNQKSNDKFKKFHKKSTSQIVTFFYYFVFKPMKTKPKEFKILSFNYIINILFGYEIKMQLK